MSEQIQKASMNDFKKMLPAFLELRPHRNEQELHYLLTDAFQQGYQLIYIGDNNIAYSILGFRILTFIFSGKSLRVDDLCTLPGHRKKGYADQLFNWVKQHAKQENCEHLSLDSGFLRHDAHRFYLNQGVYIESHHFGRKVAEL